MDLDRPRLALRGLRPRYRRYGLKGAVGYLLVGVPAYLVYERRVRPAIRGGWGDGN
jgi:hypothetical protein